MVVKSYLNQPVFLQPDSSPTLGVFRKSFKCRTSIKKVCPARILALATTAAPSLQIRRGNTSRREVVTERTAELRESNHQKIKLNGDDRHCQAALAEMWEEIQGSHHWNGLLDLVHPFLLSEIIRYGVFVRTCYEAFDMKPGSKYHGCCKYGRKNLFGQLGLENCGYQVTKYIYATPDINYVPDFLKNNLEPAGDGISNWIGYVAVSADEKEIKRLGRRDIVVALRGTVTYGEWFANLTDILTPARLNPLNPRKDVKVEMGFLGLYTCHDSACRFNNGSAREQLLSEIARLIQKYKGDGQPELSITITGHSMGSALAMLCAYDLAEIELINRPDYEELGLKIKERCEELGLKILRIVNVHDVVTKIPGVISNENFRLWENFKGSENFPWNYCHVGVELALDHKLYSLFFKPKAQHPSCIHDLATYLQLLTCRSIYAVSTHRIAALIRL